MKAAFPLGRGGEGRKAPWESPPWPGRGSRETNEITWKLRSLPIMLANQVLMTDITYIPTDATEGL